MSWVALTTLPSVPMLVASPDRWWRMWSSWTAEGLWGWAVLLNPSSCKAQSHWRAGWVWEGPRTSKVVSGGKLHACFFACYVQLLQVAIIFLLLYIDRFWCCPREQQTCKVCQAGAANSWHVLCVAGKIYWIRAEQLRRSSGLSSKSSCSGLSLVAFASTTSLGRALPFAGCLQGESSRTLNVSLRSLCTGAEAWTSS